MDIEPIYYAEQVCRQRILKVYSGYRVFVQLDSCSSKFVGYIKSFNKGGHSTLAKKTYQSFLRSRYFAKLANLDSQEDQYVIPTKEQIQIVYTSIPQESTHLPGSQLVEMCLQAGVSQGALQRVVDLSGFDLKSDVCVLDFLALLMMTIVENFVQMVSLLFEVFGEGGRLDVDTFIQLFDTISLWDTSITEDFRKDLKQSLDQNSFLSFAALGKNPVLQSRLNLE
eukprot:TRINITY_DN48890_c0_g1_i1.p2 TRINITY_DN48890_c0_g1~~TRINITY_DN48890_c0_g1_i1.p2  ORF type:complete len:239 (+),score=20.18 TRINITY_DN48890_c0_g1_i1:45-719(+)